MIDATDDPNVGRCLAVAMGIEWARADAVDMLVEAFDFLRTGGKLAAVGSRLRSIAVFLEQAEARPLEMLEYRLQERHREIEAIVAAREAAA